MLILLSPAKTLDFSTALPFAVPDQAPQFLHAAAPLVKRMRTYDAPRLAGLMSLSTALAELNVQRFAAWSAGAHQRVGRAALFAFAGDVYTGLDAYTLTRLQVARAERIVRILSGLYGLLRPCDRIAPYRLEMGTALETGKPGHLYGYWRTRVTAALNQAVAEQRFTSIVNLASQEYFSVVDQAALQAPVITPVFEEFSHGRYQVVSFFAKRARGMMCRYALMHRLEHAAGLKKFDLAGYRFDRSASTATRWVFRRHMKE